MQITFNRYDLGIDLRKGPSVSDANRLREMTNAYVTTGMAAQKRPGLVHVANLEPGTKGLFAGLGKLNTFYSVGTIAHVDPLFKANSVAAIPGVNVAAVPFADVFNGIIYAAVEYDNGQVRHHYLNGASGTTAVTDANCPHTKAVLKGASKIFAVGTDGSTVRYSKTGNPRDWTTVNDAGFLPTGLNAQGARETQALGMYSNKLVALHRDGAQVWNIDPDPTLMALEDSVENVGTRYPNSLASVGGDLFFLSDFGYRSITTTRLLDKREDVDVGSPIDPLVKHQLKNVWAPPLAVYFYGTGQYLCAIGDTLYVYSLSRTSKIAAWSKYILPVAVDAMTELDGILYIRTGDSVYRFDEDAHTDVGTPFEVLIEMPHMDFKKPGILKRVYAIDIAMEGECHFSLGFDVRNPDARTDEARIIGTTAGGGLIPVECCGTEFAPRFRNLDGKPFRIDSLTIYFDQLGPV